METHAGGVLKGGARDGRLWHRRRVMGEPISDAVRATQRLGYTTMPWGALCEAVSCLQIEQREGRLLPLAKAANTHERPIELATLFAPPGLLSVQPPVMTNEFGRGVRDSNLEKRN